MTRKNNNKVSAKVNKAITPILPNSCAVEINGFMYSFTGSNFGDSLLSAIDEHVEEDREFKREIYMFLDGGSAIEICAPAALCTFGFITEKDLIRMLVSDIFEEEEDNGKKSKK